MWVFTGAHGEDQSLQGRHGFVWDLGSEGAYARSWDGAWLYSPKSWVTIEPQADCSTSQSTNSVATEPVGEAQHRSSAQHTWAPALQGLLFLLVWLGLLLFVSHDWLLTSSWIVWLAALQIYWDHEKLGVYEGFCISGVMCIRDNQWTVRVLQDLTTYLLPHTF